VQSQKRIVIVGATSAIAEHCARIWTQETKVHFVLVGRNAAKLEQISTDLQIRGSSTTANVLVSELENAALVSSVVESSSAYGKIDIVLIAHGSLPVQADCETSPQHSSQRVLPRRWHHQEKAQLL